MVSSMRHRFRLFVGIVFACGSAWSAAQPAATSTDSVATATEESRVHQVRKGDTFESIARRHRCRVNDLIALNGLKPTTVLQIGMQLKVPSSAKANIASEASAMPQEGTYTIAKGDTFAVLSKKYGIATAELLAANPGVNPNNLQIGQVVRLKRDATPTESTPPPTTESASTATPSPVESTSITPTPAAAIESAPAESVDPAPQAPPVAIVVQENKSSEPTIHIVRKGDTFASIAKQHRVSARQIEQANPGVKSNRLRIGQSIRLSPEPIAPKSDSKAAEQPVATPPPPTQPTPVAPPSPATAPITPAPPSVTPAAATEPAQPAPTEAPAAPTPNASPETAPPAVDPAPEPPPPPPTPEVIKHEIRRVEEPKTYAEFAASHGCTVELLNELNNFDISPDQILSPGAEFLVPIPSKPGP